MADEWAAFRIAAPAAAGNDPWAAFRTSPLDQLSDVVKSAGIGAAKGTIGLAGAGGDIGSLIEAGAEKLKPGLGEAVRSGLKAAPILGPLLSGPRSSDIQKKIEETTGEFRKPETRAGRYAETIGEFAPAVAAGPGGALRRLLTQAAIPGAASEAAGEATKDTPYEPYARIAAALGTPAIAQRAITPFPSSPERQRLVDVLRGEGVDSLTAGQVTGSRPLRYAESVLGDTPFAGQSATRIQNEGQRQFTGASMARAGRPGELATPEVLNTNQQRLGNEFQQLAARNDLHFDRQFATDLNAAIGGYARVPPSQQKAVVEGYVDDIIGHIQQGQMPGPQYQEMRSRLSRQANSLRNSDPTLSEALRDFRNALDGAMTRSISPADAQAWQTARREYAAQKTLEKSASRAGEATGEGNIVPANLRNTVAAENRGRYSRGEGEFSDLARAGSTIMAPLPNSGTPARLAAMNLLTLPGAAIGLSGGPAGGIAGALAGAAIPPIVGRMMMSTPVQRALSNQIIPQNRDEGIAAIVRALISAQPGQVNNAPRQ